LERFALAGEFLRKFKEAGDRDFVRAKASQSKQVSRRRFNAIVKVGHNGGCFSLRARYRGEFDSAPSPGEFIGGLAQIDAKAS